MKLETWRFAGPADATTIVNLLRREFAYLVRTVCIRMTTIGAGSLLPNVTLLDGTGLPYARWQADNAATLSAGQTMIATFSNTGLPVSAQSLTADGGIITQSIGIPPDLWIVPQDQIQLHVLGATAGGSGVGDTWIDTSVSIGRR